MNTTDCELRIEKILLLRGIMNRWKWKIRFVHDWKWKGVIKREGTLRLVPATWGVTRIRVRAVGWIKLEFHSMGSRVALFHLARNWSIRASKKLGRVAWGFMTRNASLDNILLRYLHITLVLLARDGSRGCLSFDGGHPDHSRSAHYLHVFSWKNHAFDL